MFTSKVVDNYVAEWQFEGYEWLIKNLSLKEKLEDVELWLPIEEHFDKIERYNNHALAKHIFNKICTRCGIQTQSIRLVPTSENKGGFLGESAIIQTEGQLACGRYFLKQTDSGQFEEKITYDIDLYERPNNLIATLAHETAHALHNRSHNPLDTETELYELFTDLTAVYMGYGIFLANSRFSFESNSLGWQAKGAGYLPEADLVFATAIFMKVKDIPLETAKPHLKPKLFKVLKKSFKLLRHISQAIDDLKAITPIIVKRSA